MLLDDLWLAKLFSAEETLSWSEKDLKVRILLEFLSLKWKIRQSLWTREREAYWIYDLMRFCGPSEGTETEVKSGSKAFRGPGGEQSRGMTRGLSKHFCATRISLYGGLVFGLVSQKRSFSTGLGGNSKASNKRTRSPRRLEMGRSLTSIVLEPPIRI